LLLQVNRRQAQADAVAADYAALQQDHVSLENELLEARSQVQLLQAEVRGGACCGPCIEQQQHSFHLVSKQPGDVCSEVPE
jgi:hypothetical protein